jgi:thiol-disulfide isomerase/thioredoxin
MLSSASTPDRSPTVLPDDATSEASAEAAPAATPVVPSDSDLLLPEEPAPAGADREFTTDFSRHTVPYSDILSGGPPKDGIPAIDEPVFIPVEDADAWLDDPEPVILVRIDGDARAYPIQILMWHEIVNDTLGDVPVTVTFCPLCNTAIAFDRRIDDLVLDFGTTGRLRYSNLIMYDRQTETWWQQATGEAIAGRFAGRSLTFLPATMIAWADFKASYPDGQVLSQATGFSRQYGRNPYTGYDDINNSPFLFDGPGTPGRLPPMARVFTLDLKGEAVAYDYSTMQNLRVVNDVVGGESVVVVWQPGVASALDQGRVAEGRDVGTVVAFSRELDGETLTFSYEDEHIVDDATGTRWDISGHGREGARAGQDLTPMVGVNHFWFSWAAFKPETSIYQGGQAGAEDAGPATTDDDAASAEGADDADGGGAAGGESSPQVVDALKTDFGILVYQGADELGGEALMFSDVLALGKPVIVNFWAGLCPSCRREMPELQVAYEAHGDAVIFIAVDVGAYTGLGERADAMALIEELSLTFPAGYAPDPEVMRAYQVMGIPTTLYFKPNGELFARSSGIVSADVIAEKITELQAASDLSDQ